MKKLLSTALISAALSAPAALSADEVKIGFITTLTTGAASIGQDQEKAVNLALKHIDNTMGGKKVNLIMADDGFKPEVGKQATDKLVKQDDVDFVAGYIWSHVLLASRKSVLDAGKFLISANAGHHQWPVSCATRTFFQPHGRMIRHQWQWVKHLISKV